MGTLRGMSKPMDRIPVVRLHLTAAATVLHAASVDAGGRLPPALERMAQLVDDALHESDKGFGEDWRDGPLEDWPVH